MNNSSEKKLTRLQELEINEEFQKLPEDKKVILIAGEKILEMDQYFKGLLSKLSNSRGKIEINPYSFNQNLMEDVLKAVEEKINSSSLVKKEDILELIDQRYNEEALAIENKYKFATKEAIKNMDESFGEALQRVENLSQFQIQAREEIRKNQDKIYILEEELLRQKEKNESLQRIVDETMEKQNGFGGDFLLNNYEFLGKEFTSFDDFKNFIREESRNIAENEIEKYLHEKDLFSEDISDELKDALQSKKFASDEIFEMYKKQVDNDSKLSDLEKLINKQNDEMKLLSEERRGLITAVARLIKNNEITSSEEFVKFLETPDFQEVLKDTTLNIQEIQKIENPNSALTKEEIELLVKKEAIELVKTKLDELSTKSDDEINEMILKDLERKNHRENVFFNNEESVESNQRSLETEKKLWEIEKVNSRIAELQEQLKVQIQENEQLRNELFDEISKNNVDDINSDIINNDYINYINLNDEDDMSKYNYYDGKSPIPGTKITRINNYRINNDLDSNSFDNTQEIINAEVKKIVDETPVVEEEASSWQESNQKIVDLENLVQKQEEELHKLRMQNTREVEKIINTEAMIKQQVASENDKQKEFMNSLEQTLHQLKELSNIQAQTVADLERQSRKLEEIERKVKGQEQASRYVTHDNLDQIISEKYKSQKESDEYANELRKVEEERRRIEEALELERLRLMSEINLGKDKLNSLDNNQVTQNVETSSKEQKVADKKEKDVLIVETPKKKRKQQIFYEIKVHNRPKLTRADLEK